MSVENISMAKKPHDILDYTHKMTTGDHIKRAQEIEDEKEQKKQERLEKKEEKERKARQEKTEKLIAPVLLLLTIIISLIVKFFGN